jgi:hypothetical protein
MRTEFALWVSSFPGEERLDPAALQVSDSHRPEGGEQVEPPSPLQDGCSASASTRSTPRWEPKDHLGAH